MAFSTVNILCSFCFTSPGLLYKRMFQRSQAATNNSDGDRRNGDISRRNFPIHDRKLTRQHSSGTSTVWIATATEHALRLRYSQYGMEQNAFGLPKLVFPNRKLT